MVKMADNKEIGIYLRDKILAKFDSRRSFYKVFINEKYNSYDGDDYFQEYLNAENNRWNQILNGYKGIQTQDLLIVSNILDVKIDSILTAGQLEKKKTEDDEVKIKPEFNHRCHECGFGFANYSDEYCPICGTMNHYSAYYYLKENNIYDLNEEELEEKYLYEYANPELVKYLMYLHEQTKNDSYYCFKLGEFYRNCRNDFISNDYKAFYWYKKGAENDIEICYKCLADCYADGTGISVDFEKAEYWMNKYIKSLEFKIQNNVPSKSLIFSEKYVKERREKEILHSKYYIAAYNYWDRYNNKNISKAFKILKELVEKYDFDSAYGDLALIYYNEYKDYEKAYPLFLKDCESEYSTKSRFYMGEFYYYGRIVEQDYSKALEWYKSGKWQSMESFVRMAELHAKGLGTEKNLSKAIELCNEAIEYLEAREEFNNLEYVKSLKLNYEEMQKNEV